MQGLVSVMSFIKALCPFFLSPPHHLPPLTPPPLPHPSRNSSFRAGPVIITISRPYHSSLAFAKKLGRHQRRDASFDVCVTSPLTFI